MSDLEGMPDSRTSLHGLTEEGHEAWLIRGIAGKLYHWHRRCAEELLASELRGVNRVPAAASSQDRLEARARNPAGRRRRL
jgi:hypothetical protein